MPWKWNNPFGNSEDRPEDKESKEGKKKKIPDTLVEVICGGCKKPINIRIQEKHRQKGMRTIQCHNCLHLIEVHVFTGGQVTVYQSKQDGSGREQTPYTKVWQEDHG